MKRSAILFVCIAMMSAGTCLADESDRLLEESVRMVRKENPHFVIRREEGQPDSVAKESVADTLASVSEAADPGKADYFPSRRKRQ